MDQQSLKIWFACFYEGEGSVSNDKEYNSRDSMKRHIKLNH